MYAFTTHSREESEACRLRPIDGSVERTIRLSRTTMNRAAPVIAITALALAEVMCGFRSGNVLFDGDRTNSVRPVSNSSVRIVYACVHGNNDCGPGFVRRRAGCAERSGPAPDRAHARGGRRG